MIKMLIAIALLIMPIGAQASEAFMQTIPLQILCTKGGPEEMIMKLHERTNEIPKYMMELSVQGPERLIMIIMENKNNPSATVLMVNQHLEVTCIFFTANDYLHKSEQEDMPAKKIEKDDKISI